jgi:hypothetical protein
MSHPFIAAMQAAILEVEERFMAQRGLPSPKLVRQIKETQAPASMREALASEPAVLPKHKRRGIWILENGEILEFPDAHTMREVRTQFLRPNYTQADVAYLEHVVASSYPITAERADIIMRQQKPNTAHSKRRPIEAELDVPSLEWQSRPERHNVTPEQLAREQFTGRALQRKLARIGRTL